MVGSGETYAGSLQPQQKHEACSFGLPFIEYFIIWASHVHTLTGYGVAGPFVLTDCMSRAKTGGDILPS